MSIIYVNAHSQYNLSFYECGYNPARDARAPAQQIVLKTTVYKVFNFFFFLFGILFLFLIIFAYLRYYLCSIFYFFWHEVDFSCVTC